MHELSIAADLLREVLALGERHGARRVESIDVEVGVLRLVVAEALREAFDAVSRGTLAEGARLNLTEVPISAACNRCRRQFAAQIDDYRCPDCGQVDVQILAGNDIIISSIALDVATDGEADEDTGR